MQPKNNKTAEDYNTAFETALAQLNPAQRKAVDTVEGPVLVVAGPGAGKTTILTTRIGAILLNTDARPQNVLCLTFTDAAAHNMRQRLLQTIGPEAHNVAIHTFHAFCNRIIQENIEYFSTPRQLEPLTELERIEMIRNLLEELPSDHLLRVGRKGAFDFEQQVKNLFSLMKTEGWTAERVGEAVVEYLEDLPTKDGFFYKNNTRYGKKGDPRQAKIDDVTQKLERLKATAALFPTWSLMLHEAGRYEYADMILWVNSAFKKHPNLLLNYQERYQYMLVDEYQDTNGAQNELLFQLVNYWDAPNIFIVGDDDQSIYEFQGARLKNLLDFYAKYEANMELIVLNENYRSQAGILEAAGALVGQNKLRAAKHLAGGIEKHSKAMREGTAAPKVYAYENRLYELTALVEGIKKRLDAGVPPEEIAVLYYKHRQADDLMKLLDYQGIAYETRRPQNLFEVPLVQQLLDLLDYLDKEHQFPFDGERFLFRLLHWPQFDLPTLDLACIAAAMTKQRADLYENPSKGDTAHTWRTALADADFLKKNGINHAPKYAEISAILEGLIRSVQQVPLPQLLNRIFSSTGLMAYLITLPDKTYYVQILHTFMTFVQRESTRKAGLTLNSFLDTVESMKKNNLSMPMQQLIRTGAGIQLMTAHSAKGLEFDTVFIPDCNQKLWGSTTTGNRGHFSMPDTLTFSTEEDAQEAMRRLFFVAMTRAKNELVLSFSNTKSDGKPSEAVQFIAESNLEAVDAQPELETTLQTQIQLLLEPEKPRISLPEATVLQELLENFSLSVTALNRFLRCRLAFYYVDFLKIPDSNSEFAAYGQAMHAAMQQYFQKMKLSKSKGFSSARILCDFFELAMQERKAFIRKKQFQHLVDLGKANLTGYREKHLSTWRSSSVVERRVRRTEVDGVPLKGTIDRIDFQANGLLHIMDYKTGNPSKSRTKNKLKAPNEKHPTGGDYWRQMFFYKLMLEKSGMYAGNQVVMGRVSFLDPDNKGEYSDEFFSFHPEGEQQFRSLLKSTWTSIKAFDFQEGCGEEDCAWCGFHTSGILKEDRGMREEVLDDV